MGQLIIFAAASILFFNPLSAWANKNYCHALSESTGYDIKKCQCGRNLKSYSLVGTSAFPLVAVCGYSQESWGTEGAFYFVGSIALSGEIRREESTSLGDTLEFYLQDSSRETLPIYLWNLRFSDSAIGRFRVPKINAKAPCWTARTSIILKTLSVLEGPGTDNDGSFASDYVVSKVGKFKKCKTAE